MSTMILIDTSISVKSEVGSSERPTPSSITYVAIDLDCLIAAHEQRPQSKPQASAWEYLSELTSATMQGNAYIIPSAKWSNTRYIATATTCTCEGHAHGRYCWHRAAAATLDIARENDAIDMLAEREYAPVAPIRPVVSRRAAETSGILDLFA